MVTLWRSTKGELFSWSPDCTPVALKFHSHAAGMCPVHRQASLALDYGVETLKMESDLKKSVYEEEAEVADGVGNRRMRGRLMEQRSWCQSSFGADKMSLTIQPLSCGQGGMQFPHRGLHSFNTLSTYILPLWWGNVYGCNFGMWPAGGRNILHNPIASHQGWHEFTNKFFGMPTTQGRMTPLDV